MTPSEDFKSLSAVALNGMTTKEAALTLADKLHLPLLPVCSPDHEGMLEKHKATCKNPGKAPWINNWPIRATDEAECLRNWFASRPNSNLGMTLGSKVGMIAIDVDGEYGRKVLAELSGVQIPVTWQFSTPGGGLRYLFKSPLGMRFRKRGYSCPEGRHEELAFLGDGQMTVLPPSHHRNGGKYEWLPSRGPGDVPLADAPDWMLTPERGAEALFDDEETLGPDPGPDSTRPSPTVATRPGPGNVAKPATPAGSDTTLEKLAKRCPEASKFTKHQQAVGCDEPSWHRMVSMLVRSGHVKAALAFSRLSHKHDARSEERIRQMEEEGNTATYGATRCTTFGCDAEQIRRCHGHVRTDKETGEISNSPAAFLSSGKTKQPSPASASFADKKALLSGRYAVDSHNLCSVQTDKEGNHNDVPLANFFAWIEKDILRDDGAERQRLYEIKGVILSKNKPLPPILVPASEFDGMKWIAMWGAEPNIQPGYKIRDTVRHAIQSTALGSAHEQIFAHLGWVRIDGFWRYLHAKGALGLPGVNVEIDPRLSNFVLPDSCDNPVEAMEASISLLEIAPHRVTLPLWGLVFLSPLCEWLRKVHLEPKFLVWLHGYTGSRKTTLAKLFLCHFGNLLEHPPASFKDTANSVEKRGFDAKDSLLLIDDYHPTDNPREAKAMTQLAQQILRGYGDRVARGRMMQDTRLRPDYPPRGMAIATAEDVLSGGSSVARLSPVQLTKTDVDLDKLTSAQMNAHKLSEAMVGYLGWLGRAMDERDDKRLTEVFYERRNEASRLNVHGRLVEAAAWLYLGLSFGLEYAASIGAVENSRRQDLLSEAWELFLGTASEQGQQVAEIKATTRFLSIVAELLANKTIYTNSISASVYGRIPTNGTHVGWHDSKLFYFLPDVLYNTVCRFLTAQGTQFSITSQTLWKQLADEGVIVTETSMENGKERRHNLAKKTIFGNRTRKLCVKAEALLGKDEEERESKVRKRPRGRPPKNATPDLFAPEDGGNAP